MTNTPDHFAKLKRAEERRVEKILRRDREDYAREISRKAAELEFKKGKTVNVGDITIEPTEEWKAKGPFETFTPRLEDGTVKTVKAHRRILGSVIRTLWGHGKLTDDQYAACVWYAAQWEDAGLVGRVKTNHISLTGNVGGGGGAGQAPMAIHEREAIARLLFREARDAISAHLVRMFEAVVLDNLSLNRATRFVRCRNGQGLPRFRAACAELITHLEANRIDYSGRENDDD